MMMTSRNLTGRSSFCVPGGCGVQEDMRGSTMLQSARRGSRENISECNE